MCFLVFPYSLWCSSVFSQLGLWELMIFVKVFQVLCDKFLVWMDGLVTYVIAVLLEIWHF